MRIHTPYSCFAEIPQIIEEVASKFGLQCISGKVVATGERNILLTMYVKFEKGAALLAKICFEALKQPAQDSLFRLS